MADPIICPRCKGLGEITRRAKGAAPAWTKCPEPGCVKGEIEIEQAPKEAQHNGR